MPLTLGDTIDVAAFFQWGQGTITGKSYRANNDTIIIVNKKNIDCYHFIEMHHDYFNGIRFEEIDHLFVDKNTFLPIKIYFIKSNNKEMLTDTTVFLAVKY